MSKLELLRGVLPVLSSTRSMPGLVSEFQDMLIEIGAGRARVSGTKRSHIEATAAASTDGQPRRKR
jgi:hypothetical protein